MSQPEFARLRELAHLDFSLTASAAMRVLSAQLSPLLLAYSVVVLETIVQTILQTRTVGTWFAAPIGILFALAQWIVLCFAEATAMQIAVGEMEGVPVALGVAIDRTLARAGKITPTTFAFFWGMLWRFFLLIVPGVIYLVRSSVWTAVVVLEPSEDKPIARSRELLQGSGWVIAAVYLVGSLPAVGFFLASHFIWKQSFAMPTLAMTVLTPLLAWIPATWGICARAVLYWHAVQRRAPVVA